MPTEQTFEAVRLDLTVAKDLSGQAWADDLAGMHRNDRLSAIRVLQYEMTASFADDLEAGFGERSD